MSIDYLSVAALDPRCLMLVTPREGGMWHSLLDSAKGVVPRPTIGLGASATPAERLGLISKTNIRVDRGAFEAVNRDALYHVATAIDLRGYAGDLTLLAAVDIAETAAPASIKRYDLINQGAANIALTQSVFSWYVTLRPSGLRELVFLASDGERWYESYIPYNATPISAIKTIAVTINKATMEYRWYINGEFAARATVARWGALNALPTAFSSVYVGYRSYRADFWPDNLPGTKYAAIFSRVLSPGEIKLFI